MIRIGVLLALAAMLSCAPTPAQNTVDGDEGLVTDLGVLINPLEQFAVTTPPQPNESYLVKQAQTKLAACLAPMVWELSDGAPDSTWPPTALHSTGGWRKDNQKFSFRGTIKNQPYTGAYVKFSNVRWDPDQSEMKYGPTRLMRKAIEDNDGKTKLIQNDSDAPVDVHYTETESLTNSFTMTVTHGMTMDMSVDSTQEVGGSYAGVEAKVSVSEHFGVSKTNEQSQEKSQEGTKTEEIGIEFTANPGEYYLVTISKEREYTTQDFWIDGVLDFDFEINFGHVGGVGSAGHNSKGHRQSGTVHLTGVDGFQQYVYGYDTDHPSMSGYYDSAWTRTKNGLNCVLDAKSRTLQVSGVNQNNLESNADYKVESLGNNVPEEYKHLPVEDANDIN